MAISMKLRVTPELLKGKSGEVAADVEAMIRNTQIIINQIEETQWYWKGEAGDSYRRRMVELVDRLNAVYIRLRSYPVRIQQMAGIYEETESENVQLATNLKPDIEMR